MKDNETIKISSQLGEWFSRLPFYIQDDMDLDRTEIAVFTALLRFAHFKNKDCYPSIKTLSRIARYGTTKVHYALISLEEKGYIIKKSGKKKGRANHYILIDNKEKRLQFMENFIEEEIGTHSNLFRNGSSETVDPPLGSSETEEGSSETVEGSSETEDELESLKENHLKRSKDIKHKAAVQPPSINLAENTDNSNTCHTTMTDNYDQLISFPGSCPYPDKKCDQEDSRCNVEDCPVLHVFMTIKHLSSTFMPMKCITKNRKIKIQSRLRTYTTEELISAYKNCTTIPFYMGGNPGGQIFAKIDTIYKNDDKVDELLSHTPTAKGTKEVKKILMDKGLSGEEKEESLHNQFACWA